MRKSLLLITLLVGFVGCQSVCLGTMSNTTARETLATGDGATTAFTFSFPIDTGSSGNHADLEVWLRVTSTGVETEQTETTHYTVTATNNNFTSGGTVTFVTAPAATQQILLLRATAQTQLTDFGSSGVHLAIENADDKLTRQMIDLQEEVNRCQKFPKTDAATLSSVTASSFDRANQFSGYNSLGEPAIFSSGLSADDVTVPAYMKTVIEASTSEAVFKQQTNLESGIDVQAWDAQLDDIAALAVTNSNFIVGDGANWVAESGATVRTSLGLTIGTDVHAFTANGNTILTDAGVLSIAGLTTAADKMIYTTASDTYAVTDLTSFARTILDDADAATVRATIGAGTFADRGDPAAADLDEGSNDFSGVVDVAGTWGEFNLNTIAGVPTNAKAVLITVAISDGAINGIIQVRDSANSNTLNVSEMRMQVINTPVSFDIITPITNGIVDMRASTVKFSDWTQIQMTVKGWWL